MRVTKYPDTRQLKVKPSKHFKCFVFVPERSDPQVPLLE